MSVLTRSCERCSTPYKTRVEFCGLDGAPVVECEQDPLIGKTFDRYRVTARLGGGGMAVVYRAVHEVIEREVAIKLLFGEFAADRAFAERFRREAQTASRIRHPNVVEVLDFGETPEGMSFLIMEMLHGETLADAIRAAGPFPPRRAAAVLRQVAAGLGRAHEMGFVHRDLKPGNIMLSRAPGQAGAPVETAKILDFGLVLVRSSGDDDERLTQSGQTLGTPYYMAPEQFLDGEATPRSDLYSLGAVLHEMLAGHAPFLGSLGEVINQQTSSKPPPLPKAAGLEKLARRLLEKSPKKRPQSAEEVIAAIDRLELGAPRPEDLEARRARADTVDLDLDDVVHSAPADAPPHTDDDVPPAPSRVQRVLMPVALLGGLALSAGLWLAVGPRPAALTSMLPPSLEALDDARGETRGSKATDAASPEHASAERAPSAIAADLEEAVEQALAARGLTLAEAAELSSLSPLVSRWRAALESGASESERLTDALVLEIARVRIERPLVEAKLARIERLLRDRPAASPEVRDLRGRLEPLREALGRAASEAELSRLARRFAALERDVRAR